jgi:hypothetical protein
MTFFETMETCMRERGMTYADLSRITGYYPSLPLGSNAYAWRVTPYELVVVARCA